jgi:hypothetical protein
MRKVLGGGMSIQKQIVCDGCGQREYFLPESGIKHAHHMRAYMKSNRFWLVEWRGGTDYCERCKKEKRHMEGEG